VARQPFGEGFGSGPHQRRRTVQPDAQVRAVQPAAQQVCGDAVRQGFERGQDGVAQQWRLDVVVVVDHNIERAGHFHPLLR
jgi:hypothetical protein